VIAALRGRLMEKQPARLIVDVAGVGYDVQVPLSTYGSIGDVGGASTPTSAKNRSRSSGSSPPSNSRSSNA
jgi:Holliday junction resolvasome RuvABC DNA-binding subunit